MAKPIISRISPANPGETVQIFGEHLEDCRVFVWSPPEKICPKDAFSNTPLPSRPEEAVEMQAIHSGNQVLYAEISYGVKYGCFLIWLVNGDGEAAGVVNRPEIWNQSLETAMPDDRFTLYGQNFFGFDQRYFVNTTCVLKSTADGCCYQMRWGACQDLQQYMPGQNDHKSDYRLPPEIPAGEYLYSMTNGTGGPWGWSEPRRLTVVSKRRLTEHCRLRWNTECRQNIVFPMRDTLLEKIPAACGDGFTDVTQLLQEAIDRAAVTGGFVLLPAGRFGISRMIKLRPGVILKGAGMGATTLTVVEGGTLEPTGMPPVSYASRAGDGKNWSRDWLPYMNRENNTPMVWIQTDAGMEDLKLEGGSGAVILTVVGTTDESPSEGVFFNRVHFENGVNSALFMHGTDFDVAYHGLVTTGHTKDLTLYKCRCAASYPLMVLPAQCRDLRLVGNEFEVSPRQTGDCVFISGVYGGIVTENTFLYGRRSLMCQQGLFDTWIFQNRSVGVANTTNANEEYMSEYGQTAWAGTAVRLHEDQVQVDFPLEERRLPQRGTIKGNLKEHRWFLIILRGRGLGQYRRVTRVEGDTIYLDRPWDVVPDSESFFDLVTASNHNLWVDNFTGLGSGNSQFVYGSGIENVVAGHSMLLSSGMTMYSMLMQKDEGGDIRELGVVAYNQFIGCDCRYSGMGLCLWTNESWSWLDDWDIECMNLVGNIARWNSFVGGTDSDYVKNQSVWTPVELTSGIQTVGDYCLMERNLLSGFDAGIHIRYSSHGNLAAHNRFRRNGCDILDDGQDNFVIKDEETVVRLGCRRTRK